MCGEPSSSIPTIRRWLSKFTKRLSELCSVSAMDETHERNAGYHRFHRLHSEDDNTAGLQQNDVDTDLKILVDQSIRSSPLEMSPPMSPIQKTGRQSTTPQDDNSFAIFAASFDSFTEHDRLRHSRDAILERGHAHSPHRSRTEQVGLLSLSQEMDSDYSVGDLSPIKLVYPPRSSDSQQTMATAPPVSAGRAHIRPQDTFDGGNSVGSVSNPFFVIRSARKMFENCKYMLPCIRQLDLCSVSLATFGPFYQYQGLQANILSVTDIKIATRRVEAAICAFGGNLNSNIASNKHSSIFRLKGAANDRQLYKQRLSTRYCLSSSHISWEMEEDPLIHVPIESEEGDGSVESSRNSVSKKLRFSPFGSSSGTPTSFAGEGSKLTKYRCTLCGQLKQNHNCPKSPSLQRSIGVMVYPAVNSFTAAEPGIIAPPLTHMNNFVSYESDYGSPLGCSSSARTAMHLNVAVASNHAAVTPEVLRPNSLFHSPQSSLSIQSDDGAPNTLTPMRRGTATTIPGAPRKRHCDHPLPNTPRAKRPHFVPSVILRPEHYRAVTATVPRADEYDYPTIPLTFAERKRLSDTLFYLSKEIPTLTADCAAVLRQAREQNEWDLAVGEILTQVVVGLYCAEGDTRLDGLQQYLLALGISC